MELKRARGLAEEMVGIIGRFCKRVEIVGSIRRGKEFPNDFDILFIPVDINRMLMHLVKIACKDLRAELFRFRVGNLYSVAPGKGKDIVKVVYKGFDGQLFRSNEESWPMLELIRTGPESFNREIIRQAQAKGLEVKVGAETAGLYLTDNYKLTMGNYKLKKVKKGWRVMLEREEDVFGALGLQFVAPGGRR